MFGSVDTINALWMQIECELDADRSIRFANWFESSSSVDTALFLIGSHMQIKSTLHFVWSLNILLHVYHMYM